MGHIGKGYDVVKSNCANKFQPRECPGLFFKKTLLGKISYVLSLIHVDEGGDEILSRGDLFSTI